VRDRPTTAHEYVFLLTKSKTYFYDADAIREKAKVPYDPNFVPTKRDWREIGWPTDSDGKAKATGNPIQATNPQAPAAGRNKRTVWEIATAPYPGAHYATFPPKLVEPMILTTPTKVCAECGAGWERVTEAHPTGDLRWAPSGGLHRANVPGQETSESSVFRTGGWNQYTTLGFRPTCSCDAETKPAVILDPFCGRGTVLKEARAHGRDWIGIDVDPQSIKLAEEWMNLGDVEYETAEESWVQPRLTIMEPG